MYIYLYTYILFKFVVKIYLSRVASQEAKISFMSRNSPSCLPRRVAPSLPWVCFIQLKISIKKTQWQGQAHSDQKKMFPVYVPRFYLNNESPTIWIFYLPYNFWMKSNQVWFFHIYCIPFIIGKYIWKTKMTSLAFIPLVHLKVQRPEIKIHTYILPEIQNICKKKVYLVGAPAQPTSILTLSPQCYLNWASQTCWATFWPLWTDVKETRSHFCPSSVLQTYGFCGARCCTSLSKMALLIFSFCSQSIPF